MATILGGSGHYLGYRNPQSIAWPKTLAEGKFAKFWPDWDAKKQGLDCPKDRGLLC